MSVKSFERNRPEPVVIMPVAALLISVSLLVLGNGLQGTLLVVRGGIEGFPTSLIGTMMAAYFVGYVIGSWLLPGLIVSAGHIRAFAGFASIASAVAIMHVLVVDPWAWMILRVATGLVYAGMILVTESWLNGHAVKSSRGRLLSIYGMVTMGIWAAGQGLLNVAPADGVALFLIISILVSFSLVPITLLPSRPPTISSEAPFGLRDLFGLSPLGSAGALLSGLALSAFWAMGPAFAQARGLDAAGIAAFMSAALLGALAFQWPLGWLSDRFQRRLVIAGAGLAAAFVAVATTWNVPGGASWLFACSFLFGGFGIPLYTLSVAHANDRLEPDQMLSAARGLLLLNGIGAACGAFAAGLAMSWLGPRGLFLQTAVFLGLLVLIALARRAGGPQETGAPTPLVCAPMITMALDTRGEAPAESGDQSDGEPAPVAPETR